MERDGFINFGVPRAPLQCASALACTLGCTSIASQNKCFGFTVYLYYKVYRNPEV